MTPGVQIVYAGPPTLVNGVVQVIVGQRLSPGFEVRLGSVPQQRARYVLSLPDLADTSVLRIFGNGDSVEVLGRGSARLKATLVGATVGISLSDTASVDVVATPAQNSVDSTSLTFHSLGVGKTVTGASLRQDGSRIPLNASSLTWTSADPTIAGVTKLTDSTAVVTSLGNGTTTITATFDGIDAVIVPVTVSQIFSRFQLATAAFGTGEVTLVSLGEQITVTATPLDANGQSMLAGSQAVPAPNFASTNSGRASVSPVSGVVTAVDNTDPIAPARVYATASGVPRSDSLSVVVRQRAVTIVISGVRTDTISSIGATKNFIAVARDANNRDLPPSFISWSTTDQTIAQANGGPPVVVTGIGVGTTRLAASRPADNVGDTITLVVTNDPASIVLVPDSLAILSLDDTVQFASATVRNTKGDVLAGAAITWISLNPAIVEAMPDGRMVSHALGSTSVIARTANGVADTSRVVVTNAPETLDIIPTDTTLTSSGDTITVPVDFRNSRGVALPPSSASWSSADVSVARVAADGSGRVIGVGTGDTYILAVSPVNPARRDSLLVTVSNEPAAIATSPSTAQTLSAFGSTIQFSATVFNAKGNVIPNAPVRWSLPSGSAFVTIDSVSGLVTSVANGVATVRARSGTITSDIQVTVAQAFSPSRSTIIPTRGSIAADGADTTTVTIQLRDANDNNYVSGGVTVAPSTSRGTLSPLVNQGNGTYTVLLTSGTQSGPASIAATVNSVAISNSALVQFLAGPPTQYVVVVLPNAAPLAGSDVTIVAQLADQFGNPVTNQVKTVTWSSTNGGTLTPATPVTTSNGRAFVTFTTSSTAGTAHTVTATDNTTPTALTGSAAILTRSGGPTRYIVSSSSSSPAAGDSVVITARLADAAGNFERIPGRTVTWSSTGGGGFARATSVTDGDGIATVRFGVNTTSGTSHTVTATDGSLNGTSPSFTTIPGAAAALFIRTQPSDTALAGVQFTRQPVIEVRDAHGNLRTSDNATVVTAARAAGSGTLQGTVSLSASGGVVTFTDLRYALVETMTIAFTAATGLATSANVVVVPGPVSGTTTLIGASPSSIVANGSSTATITIQARDAQGNFLTGSAGVATLATTLGTLSAVTDNNDGTYTATLTAGTATGTATVTGTINGSAISDNAQVTFTPSPPVKYLVTTPASFAAGVPTVVNAQLADIGNNPVPISGKTVVWSVAGPGGTFQTASSITDANGVASVAFTGTIVGSHSITATDNTALTGTSPAFDVTFGALASFRFEPSSGGGSTIGSQTAGVAFGVRITAVDAYGNRVDSFNGTGILSGGASTTVQGQPITTAAFTSGRINSMNVVVTSAGTGKSIMVTRSGGSESGTSNTFTVSPSTLNNFLVESAGGGPLGAQTAGTPFNIRVVAQDLYNNTVTGFTGTVVITGGPGTTLVGQPMTSANFTAGVLSSHSVTINTTGTGRSITATNSSGTQTGTSALFDVDAGALASFVVEAAATGPIGPQTAGVPFDIRVTAYDALNNLKTNYTGSVTFTSGSTIGSGAGPVGSFVNGVLASHSITLNTSGSHAITAADGGVANTSNTFTVNPGAAASFSVTGSATQVAGTSQGITITARDAFGNTATGYTGTQSLTFGGAGIAATGNNPTATNNVSAPVNFGSATSVNFTAGVASSSIALYLAENAAITVSAAGPLPTPGPLAVVVSPAALNNFLVEAAGGGAIGTQTAGVAFDIRTTARDVYDNTQTGFTGSVTFTSSSVIGAGAGPSAAFVAGVLASHSITLNTAGSQSITATGSGSTGTSASFTVDPAVASLATSTVTASSAVVLFGGSSTIEIQLKDAFGNNTANAGGSITLTTDAGTLQGALTDQGGGRYTQTLDATPELIATATLRGFINLVQITDTATVTW